MDKKLILDIENIEFTKKKSKTNSTLEDLRKNLSMLLTVLKMYESINIKRLTIADNEFKIILYSLSPTFNLSI